MNAVVQFQAPRLPFHPVVEERFGVDKAGWKVLCEAVFPAAESPDSIVMALAYCKARSLDIFKKPVQIVPIYDKKRGGLVDTVWPGISELRTTAMRTGTFAGFDETTFGPIIEDTLGGVAIKYPEWAQCTVYRIVAGQRVPFIGPKVYWLETYATAKRDTAAPNAMWKKRPRGQLEKCAEAAALRRAFPEEIGNEYAAEEIEGQSFGVMRDVTPQRAGVMSRLPGGSNGEGFHAHVVEDAIGAEQQDQGANLDVVLDGDAIPDHDPQTGEVIETEIEGAGEASDATGPDAPAEPETPASDDPGPATAKSDAGTPADLADGDFDHVEWSGAFVRSLERLDTVEAVASAWEEAKTKGFVFKVKAKSPDLAKQVADAVNARVAEIKAAG